MSYNSSFTGQQADAALQKAAIIQTDGAGTQFLSNDGTYKAVSSQPMQVLTESEYAALGTTPETDGVLYFVTPD